ncbi:hydantoinase B/oxoprolinase family protein [Methylobacterium nodulans]|uniref:Hydantoinase B/oxoprolinase n=1 Tax=Methylobacterium nodulans (strain LMG 21967 / CNCM I-2342 / ORS 2060) TaxID=460265 RepID=B8IME5_METNO|nr:hydantoinase B/oxoprolinase family protein [Methylobacterium nodulans]ACL58331.1 Hydantoinase B/oxoprolinase [Methylobacterium nodulans ORS 2060]
MSKRIDPITFAVLKSALESIVDDMAYTVMRTARSPIVRDVLDYSTTMCDAKGRILAQAKTVALHLGAVPDAMEALMRHYGDDLHPGDVIIFNDPYDGGMHLPDIFMFKPIFAGPRHVGFSVVICHHCDVGGRVPGSNASDSTEIFQEGLRIPPLKLLDKGVRNKTLFNIIAKNVRLPDLVIGDLDAQLATCALGERELLRLVDKYGIAQLEGFLEEFLDYGERLSRRAFAAWPDGTYRFTDYIDGDGFDEAPIPIRVAVTVEGDGLIVDFAGSSPQVRGAINSTLSFVKSATYLAVRCTLDADVPNNAGLYRCIDIRAPKGSLLNPDFPAPVAARALTGYRVVDTVLGALAQIVPDRVSAAGEGGNSVVCLGGYDKETREPFIVVDMINGALGARAGKDGIDAITNPSQNMSNMPVEIMEATYPLMIEEYALRPDSGGAGRNRGGIGVVRQYRLLADEAVMQLRTDRYTTRPYGLFGGEPGLASRNILTKAETGTAEVLPSKITRTVRKGDVIRHEQAGGGGYGNPHARDPARVLEDVIDGKVTERFAREGFGVVIREGAVDDVATARLRGTGTRSAA